MEYLTETLLYMRSRESRLVDVDCKSPQLDQRRVLVDWTCTSAEKLQIPKSATHLAVILLDRFMDGHDIGGSGQKLSTVILKHTLMHLDESLSLQSVPSCLHFVCLASLSISVKFDCKETRLPKFSKLKSLLDFTSPCSAKDFRDLEAMILAYFDWNIFIPSPTHYVDLLMQHVLHTEDLVAGATIEGSFDEVLDCLTDFIHYFLDVSMQEVALLGVNHAKIAGAAIFSARAVLEISPVWPSSLQRLMMLSAQDFNHCARLMLATYVLEDSTQAYLLEDVVTHHEEEAPPRKKAKVLESSAVATDEGYVSRNSFMMEDETPTTMSLSAALEKS